MIIGQDTFIRANQAGWGIASNGETWNRSGDVGTTYSIVSNQGQITNTTNNSFQALGSTIYFDTEQQVRIKTSSNAGGNWQGLFSHYSSVNNFYACIVRSGALYLTIQTTQLNQVAFVLAANTEYQMKFRVQGGNLFGKIWLDGNTEPAQWTVTAFDTTYASGLAGIFASPDNVATTSLYDHFSVNALDNMPVIPGSVIGPSITNLIGVPLASRMGPVQGRRAMKLYGKRGLVGRHPFKRGFWS